MPQNRTGPPRILTDADLPGIVGLARRRREDVEADPAAAVQPQVEAKVTELRYRGLLPDPDSDGESRRLLAEAFQRDAGIAEPRHYSNQARAELANDFRQADLAGRVGLLEALEAVHGPNLLAVAEEVFEALPPEERPGARRLAERFAAHRRGGLDPLLGLQLDALPEDLAELSRHRHRAQRHRRLGRRQATQFEGETDPAR